jgi:tetratricopeptide (TPR) repeat protein
MFSTAAGTAVVIITIHSERNGTHMDRQALVKLVDLVSQVARWASTGDNNQAVFTNVNYGRYDVEVSAVGYFSAQKEIIATNLLGMAQYDVVLHRDPTAISLDMSNGEMPPKARREMKRAVSALKSAHFEEAQKFLDAAYRLAPSNADLNFLLGYLYVQTKKYEEANKYLTTATDLNPHNPQAFTLLGTAGLQREDYPAARSALEKAVMGDYENWLPHNLLADTYLRENDYNRARDEAQLAITKGKTRATRAQLVLGQALVGLGQDDAGIQALNAFLEASPDDSVVPQVRSLIAEVRQHTADPSSAPPSLKMQLPHLDSSASLPPSALLSIKAWQPPGVDEVKLAIAPGVSCPTGQVIAESGKRTRELIDDVMRFAAVEDLFHQDLDPFGNPVRIDTRKFDYVASIAETLPGFLSVQEYRSEKLSASGYPDGIATSGFAALALVFHPDVRDHFEMLCEGLGDWHGQPSWLVHFRQRDDRPNTTESYSLGNQQYLVKLKGRAWITADKFEIARIEAEMTTPIPEIQLLSEHQIVEYGPIPFPKKNTTLWLPKTAEIYSDFRKHRYYRRHSFDHYMLYSVDSEEKRKEPVSKPESKPN